MLNDYTRCWKSELCPSAPKCARAQPPTAEPAYHASFHELIEIDRCRFFMEEEVSDE